MPRFYDDPQYKQKQAEITRKNWQDGIYNQKRVIEIRYCKNTNCNSSFQIKPYDPKIYCSRRCAALVNNSKRGICLSADELHKLYFSGLSMADIAEQLKISVHKVTYWMDKYKIPKRSISDAVYLKNHPDGDPFTFKTPSTADEAKLLGLGLGLYWGEGNKLNKTSVKLSNTDPDLINYFMKFLIDICGVQKNDLKFSLQIFTDIDLQTALDYWINKLDIKKGQFYKPVITKSNSLGTYRKKSEYGVIIVNYHNRKLRDLIVGMLPTWLSGRARSW